VEKHFTLSRSIAGPDSAFSLEPEEFAEMVRAVRSTQGALGTVQYEVGQKEEHSRSFRRSLFVVEDMEVGDKFTAENVRTIRPAHGLHPRFLPDIIGKRSSRAIDRGTPVDWSLVSST
jgi:N-acetylneuraminate synthase